MFGLVLVVQVDLLLWLGVIKRLVLLVCVLVILLLG